METTLSCPYCGEENTVVVDTSGGGTQEYVEDCQVCCKPWQVLVTGDGKEVDVQLRPMGE